MKSVALACASILVVSGLFLGVTAQKPSTIPSGEIIIQEGDELKIKCQGEGRLQFSTQDTIVETTRSEFSVLEDEDSGTYTFIRSNTRKEDSGWYACAKEDVDITNDEEIIDHESEDIAWVYVYVKSSEPFVVEASYDLILAVAGDRLVVPCRATSPDLPVKLEINWGMTKVPADTKYDPKIGFIINEACREQSGQIFECLVDGPQPITMSYVAHVTASMLLETPRISEDKYHKVIRGRDLTMDCKIDVETGTKIDMSWKVPESVSEERLSYSPVPIRVGFSADDLVTWKTELTVKNFEASDDGKYYCEVDTSSNHVESSVDVKSRDPTDTYINVTVDGSSKITAYAREEAQWKIKIDSHPEEISWTWYRPNGSEITTKDLDESSKFFHDREGSNLHFFGISRLDIEDSGNYSIKLSTEIDETSIFLPLTVLV